MLPLEMKVDGGVTTKLNPIKLVGFEVFS